MGSVFGRESVEEPSYTVVLERTSVPTPYEIRKYGERIAIETEYGGDKEDGSPFMALAGYIGVMGKPQNEGQESIAMTAPVVIEGDQPSNKKDESGKGEAIAMTAPVVKSESSDGKKTMQFMLPASFDSVDKAPKPINPSVRVKAVPAAMGVVHRYNGGYSDERNREIAATVAKQLTEDGVSMTEDEIMNKYQFWGYNPPFTIPYFRRNEVWVPLSKADVDRLVGNFGESGSGMN